MDVLNHLLQQVRYNECSLFTEAKHTIHWNIILLAIQSFKFQVSTSNWFLLQCGGGGLGAQRAGKGPESVVIYSCYILYSATVKKSEIGDIKYNNYVQQK